MTAAFMERRQGAQSADYDQLLHALKDLLSIPSGTFIIIDALDESVDQTETCAFLKDLCHHRPVQTRVLVSSNTTQSLGSETVLNRLKIHIIYVHSSSTNKDIERHIRGLDLGQWNDDQKDKIVRDITEGSDGSYVPRPKASAASMTLKKL